jgi:hypothetical protein
MLYSPEKTKDRPSSEVADKPQAELFFEKDRGIVQMTKIK